MTESSRSVHFFHSFLLKTDSISQKINQARQLGLRVPEAMASWLVAQSITIRLIFGDGWGREGDRLAGSIGYIRRVGLQWQGIQPSEKPCLKHNSLIVPLQKHHKNRDIEWLCVERISTSQHDLKEGRRVGSINVNYRLSEWGNSKMVKKLKRENSRWRQIFPYPEELQYRHWQLVEVGRGDENTQFSWERIEQAIAWKSQLSQFEMSQNCLQLKFRHIW